MAGGTISDRLGRRRTLLLAQSLAVPCFFALTFGPPALIFPLLIATGLAALFFGMLADRIGVQPAFNLLGLVPLATIPFALVMRDPPRPAPVDAH